MEVPFDKMAKGRKYEFTGLTPQTMGQHFVAKVISKYDSDEAYDRSINIRPTKNLADDNIIPLEVNHIVNYRKYRVKNYADPPSDESKAAKKVSLGELEALPDMGVFPGGVDYLAAKKRAADHKNCPKCGLPK
jgi:hypothetical protein